MATRKHKRPASSKGVRRVGVKDGKIEYEVRLIARDPISKRKVVDTLRRVLADNIADAHAQRIALTNAALGRKMGGGRLRFSEAMERWTKTITRHSTSVSWSSYGRRLSRDFGDRWLDKISTDEMQLWLNRQKQARSTVGGIRTVLINLYQWAIDNGHATKPNPAKLTEHKVKRHSTDVAAKLAELETPRKNALTREELQLYGEAHRELHPQTYPLVLAMIAIGARYSEASAIKRSDINWKTGAVTIRRAQVNGRIGPPKADKARLNAFGPDVLAVLRGHVAACGESEWLFPTPAGLPGMRRVAPGLAPVWSYDTIRRHINAAMAKAGVRTDNVAHFARHTMISLTRGQMPDHILREFVGHASEQVHKGYGMEPIRQIAKTMDLALFRKEKAGG